MRVRLSRLRSWFRRSCQFCGEGDCVCRPLNWYDEMPGAALAASAARVGGRAAATVVHRVRALPVPQVTLPTWERGEIYSSI